jgi:hypothetical protein
LHVCVLQSLTTHATTQPARKFGKISSHFFASFFYDIYRYDVMLGFLSRRSLRLPPAPADPGLRRAPTAVVERPAEVCELGFT